MCIAQRGTIWGSLFALGLAGCSPSDPGTEQPLGRVEQALEFSIDGKAFTSSTMGSSGTNPCGGIDAGQWSYSDGVISVTGADGRGLGDGSQPDPDGDCARQGSFDSVNFLSTLITGNPNDPDSVNFELVVRITSIQGVKGAEVGVMMRENASGDGTGLAGALAVKNDWRSVHCDIPTPNPPLPGGLFNSLNRMNRTLVGEGEHAAYVPSGMEGPTRTRPPATPGDPTGQPMWLSIQRFRNDFRVARARDDNGRPGTWVPAGGGEYTPTHAHVGVFAAIAITNPSGQTLVPTNATFDNLSIRTGGVRYRTGALGASMISGDELERVPLASASSYVATALNSFWVNPLGTSYKNSETNDPGGLEIQLIDDEGRLVRVPEGSGNFGFVEGGIGGHCTNPTNAESCSVYAAQKIEFNVELPHPDNPTQTLTIRAERAAVTKKDGFLEGATALDFGEEELGKTRGLSADATTIFVSDNGRDPALQQEMLCNGQKNFFFTYDNPAYHSVRIVDAASREQVAKCPSTRPGPSAVDDEGNAWVIQAATGYPTKAKPDLGVFNPVHPAAIQCFTRTCGDCGSIETGLVSPTAVAFDSNHRLYVADNGPAQNIRIYDNIHTSPTFVGSFGREGGVFEGPNPGLLDDPSHGGDQRFYSLVGIGFDSSDNIYVASSAPRTTIQKFPKTGATLDLSWGAADWGFYGLGREIGAFDVDEQGNTDYYTLMRRLTLDPDSSSLDFAWKPKSIIRPPYEVSAQLPAVAAPIHHYSQGGPMRLRRIENKRFLFEINPNSLKIFRFVGELIKPFWHVRAIECSNIREFWFDANENGLEDEGDVITQTTDGAFTAEAAEDGSIWLTGAKLWEFTATGWSASGEVPIYSLRSDVPLSELLPGEQIAGVEPRFRSVGNGGVLYLLAWLGYEENPVLAARCPTSQAQCTNECTPETTLECCPAGPTCNTTCNNVAECCTHDLGVPHLGAPHICKQECLDCGAKSCPNPLSHPHIVAFSGWRATPGAMPAETYRVPLPTQLDTPTEPDDFLMRHVDPQCKCADWAYTSFDVAGDMLFLEERHGVIHIHEAATGSEVDRLYPGPEVGGLMGWSDVNGSMQAFKRPNSDEYLITTIDSFDHGRNLMFSWKQLELGEECWDPHQCKSGYCADGICCGTACDGDTQCSSFQCTNFEGTPGYCAGVLQAEGTPCDDGNPDTIEDECREFGECEGTPTAASFFPQAWYVAAEEDLTLENGAVAVWSDRSGNGHDVNNDFVYGRPTYNATGWNGTQPTVTFTGGSLLRRFGWGGPAAGTNQAFSVLGVVRSAAPHNGSIAAWWPDGGTGYGAVRASVVTSNSMSFFDLTRQEDTGHRSYASTADIGTGRHVVAWRFSPQIMKVTVDGTTYESAQQEPLGAISVDMFLIGARTNLPTWLFQGDISELVVVGSSLSDADVANFRAYAKLNWEGLP